ncbi:MAG: hypothetical protein KKF68_04010 [Nanoarchaeota archaeon]|nr:hypothetical protein [Nanoarchaeota archaeon]
MKNDSSETRCEYEELAALGQNPYTMLALYAGLTIIGLGVMTIEKLSGLAKRITQEETQKE